MTEQPNGSGPEIVRGLPPLDPGNNLLQPVPSNLTVSMVQTPHGQRMAATIRTADVTLTLFLAQDEVDAWVNVLVQGKGQMNGLILPG
jgi:hypothetical protein